MNFDNIYSLQLIFHPAYYKSQSDTFGHKRKQSLTEVYNVSIMIFG